MLVGGSLRGSGDAGRRAALADHTIHVARSIGLRLGHGKALSGDPSRLAADDPVQGGIRAPGQGGVPWSYQITDTSVPL